MKKYKTINYDMFDGNINYRLNDKKLFFKCNGLKGQKILIDVSFDLLIFNDGIIKNSLDIEVSNIDQDTYLIKYPDGREENLDLLYYYLDDNNDRVYVNKLDVTIGIDGTLSFEGHKIKTYYKSDSGYILAGDYKDFINNNVYDFKNEEITNLEQEIFNINSTIEDLNYQIIEYSKINDSLYTNYESASKLYERLQRELSAIQVDMNDSLKSYYENYYDKKQQYYSKTYKNNRYNGYGLDGSRNVSNSINQYFYSDYNGREMEKANLEGFYSDTHEVKVPNNDNTDYDTEYKTQYDELTDSYKKAKYYEQLFTYQVEDINQKIQYYSNEIEHINWSFQKSINNKTKDINNAGVDLNNKKTLYENKYNQLVKDYYNLCVERFNTQLDYYNKLLIQKNEQLNLYKKQIPVIYLMNQDKSLIYGINEYNKLCVMFDNYEHQLLVEYDNNGISSLIDEKNNKLEIRYNDSGRITNILNDVGQSLIVFYENGMISKILEDNNVINFEFKKGLLSKIISSDNLGYKLHYTNNILDKVSKISKKNNIKELHNYLYDNNVVTIIDKSKFLIENDEYVHSEYKYLFDESDSLITEIEYKNNEIINILGYEFDSNHCSFSFESSKNDEKVFEISNGIISGINEYNVSIPSILKTDYTLYAIASANSNTTINEYRKTAYCDHSYIENSTKYELRIKLSYSNEDIIYGASFNPSINGSQILAIPVSLKEDANGKVIVPNSITIFMDYSNNLGECILHALVLSECKYVYTEFNSAKQPKKSYISDVKYPIIENSIKTGYVIKSTHSEFSYNVNELLSVEKTFTIYEKYSLNDELIESSEDNYSINYYYDNNSRIVKSIDSKQNIIINEYNDNGKIVKNISYNEKNASNIIIKEYEYDEDGNLITDTNDLGYKSKYKYSIDELVEETPNGFVTNVSDLYINSDCLSNARSIKNGNIESYSNGNINYKYTYDEWGYEKELFINNNLYMTFSYSEYLGKKYYVSKLNDNTGYMKVTDLYDKILYLKKINNETQELLLIYEYDLNDNLISLKDKNNNVIESYEHIDKVLSKITNDNYEKKFSNDIYGNFISISYDTDTYNYVYNDDKELVSVYHNDYTENIKYDSLGRIENKTNNFTTESYEYLNVNNRTTNLVKTIKQKVNNRIIYNKFYYDKCGNIIKSIINHNETRYYYDGLNRLIRYDSDELNQTYTFDFDEKNNIISKGIHDLSNTDVLTNSEYIDYEYDNDNKLISFGNEHIAYDNSIRPINYKGNDLLWDNNKLIKYGNNHYEYDYNGLRIKKITPNEEIEYIRDGNRLLKESHILYSSSIIDGLSISNNSSAISSNNYEIIYKYGVSGIEGFILNNKNYHYIKNIFNDVIEIIDDTFNTYAKYVYDAYGKCNIILNVDNIANINPIRYRSYYYDNETNIYYLNSRYYDPNFMRFISLDDISYLDYDTLGGLNLWTYCNNNPVMYVDPDGNKWWEWLLGGLALVGGVIACIIPGGQVFGVGLIVAGASITTSAILDAVGVDGKVASLITSGLSIVAGIALCFTPFAGIGAGLIGQGIGSIAGGYISEAFGGSFEFGAAIGGIVGSVVGGFAYRGITSYRMGHMTPYEKGIMGEKYVQARTGIKAHTMNSGKLRPDFVKGRTVLIDSKNVISQSLTKQLIAYKNLGYEKTIIYVRLHTKISESLKNSGIIIKYFPWW